MEIVLQLMFTFFKLLLHEQSREVWYCPHPPSLAVFVVLLIPGEPMPCAHWFLLG